LYEFQAISRRNMPYYFLSTTYHSSTIFTEKSITTQNFIIGQYSYSYFSTLSKVICAIIFLSWASIYNSSMIDRFKNKKIAVIGLGVEGLSSALFLAKRGAIVSVLDQKKENKLDPSFLKILREKDIRIFGSEDYLKNLKEYDLVVRSPGVKLELLGKYVSKDKITSQIKIFFDLCPCPIIGVTGTKGKGTTSSLIYEMLRKEGFDAYLGGNIGSPPLDFLNKLNAQSKVVLELSSFQLQDLSKSPHIAVILMITSEHLDYHKDTNEYVKAKRNILKFQTSSDAAIVNKDYPANNESDIHIEGKVFQISRSGKVKEGCFVDNEKIFVSIPKGRFNTLKAEIIKTKDILLPGEHNLENVCAAAMAALLCGVSKENIVAVLKTFKGLEHRLKLVSEIDGVKFYDDSFSTIPETTIAAIKAFSDPEILILGGSSKNSDFRELGEVISSSNNIKAIIGIGIEWPRIKESIKYHVSSIKYIEGLKTMSKIVQKAHQLAKSGDVVLLSPACASFDMFKNYKDRGNQFKREVKSLI